MKRLMLILFSVIFICVAGYIAYTVAANEDFFGLIGGGNKMETPIETVAEETTPVETTAAETTTQETTTPEDPKPVEVADTGIVGTWAVTSRTVVVDGTEHTDYFEPDSMMTAKYAFNEDGTYIGADESGTWTQADEKTYTMQPEGSDVQFTCTMPNAYTVEVKGDGLQYSMNKVQ